MGCVASKAEEPISKAEAEMKCMTFSRPQPHHLVCLTSTSYGILNDGATGSTTKEEEEEEEEEEEMEEVEVEEIVETINAWELMDGLEEELSPVSSPVLRRDSDEVGSLEKDVQILGARTGGKSSGGSAMVGKKLGPGKENETPKQTVGAAEPNGVASASPSPMKERNFVDKENFEPKGCVADITPAKVGAGTGGKKRISHGPLTELRIDKDSSSRHFDFCDGSFKDCIGSCSPLFDPELLASFETSLDNFEEEGWDDAKSALKKRDPWEGYEEKCPPGGQDSVVLYTTTLRGIRKTFEDCNSVRCVLESYGICFHERDVSMHFPFRNEVEQLMGTNANDPHPLPKLFIKGRFIGGACHVLELHEQGILGELLQGIPPQTPGKLCDGCGGARFVPCLECSGSCKLVDEDGTLFRCPHCNENGLIQCPICC